MKHFFIQHILARLTLSITSIIAAIVLIGCPKPQPIETLPKSVGQTTIPEGNPPAAIESFLQKISPKKVFAYTETLASFGTRHTLSETESETRGIGAARRWIKSEFEQIAKKAENFGHTGEQSMQVYFDTYLQAPDDRRITREVEIVNVVAVLPGKMPEAKNRLYYVIGHYDSRASDPLDATSDAPGANDDASGVAALIELARVMSKQSFDSTLVFMAVAGEEQGLFGSRLHAKRVKEEGKDIRAVLSNDIVGDPKGLSGKGPANKVRVFSQGVPDHLSQEEMIRILRLGAESDSPSRQLARYVEEIASWHQFTLIPTLIFRQDRFLRGGDHKAFNEVGYPAIRFTIVEENYDRQHQDLREENGVKYGDLAKFIDAQYLANVTRLNGATLGHLANAPSSPQNARIVVGQLGYKTTLRWDKNPEPDLAGYEVVWRETTSPVWQNSQDIGNNTEITLSLSKDDLLFGVRAYDKEGYRSPVSFPGVARE